MTKESGAWGTFTTGDTVEVPFTVTDEDMATFRAFSGDDSLSHTDLAFCQAHGFDDRVVYGGLLLAMLSRLLGTQLPGRYGLSSSWTINFHRPLYVGEAAVLRGEVEQVSDAARMLKIGFRITAGDRLVAEGTALSSVLEPPADDPGGST